MFQAVFFFCGWPMMFNVADIQTSERWLKFCLSYVFQIQVIVVFMALLQCLYVFIPWQAMVTINFYGVNLSRFSKTVCANQQMDLERDPGWVNKDSTVILGWNFPFVFTVCNEEIISDKGVFKPVIYVIIFPSPAPVVVWEAVDLQKLFFAQRWHATKVLRVWQPVGDGQR